MKQMPITITALRYCLPGGLEAIPAFQQEHPAGSILLLHLNGSGHPYPGSVSVEDEEFRPVGMVAVEDLSLVRLLFGMQSEGDVMEATVVSHGSKLVNCVVEVPEGLDCKEYLHHIEPEPGELVLPLLPNELQAKHTGERVEQLLRKLAANLKQTTDSQHTNIQTADSQRTNVQTTDSQHTQAQLSHASLQLLNKLAFALQKYLACCNCSLAADDLYQRHRIHTQLRLAVASLQNALPASVTTSASLQNTLPASATTSASLQNAHILSLAEPCPHEQTAHPSSAESMPQQNAHASSLAEPKPLQQNDLHEAIERLQTHAHELYERLKDFKHKGNPMLVWQQQWQEIWKRDNGTTDSEAHFALRYLKGWSLPVGCQESLDSLRHQEKRITQLLDQATGGIFTRYTSDRDYFIEHLFYSLPDRQTLYLIYGRILVWEYLNALIYDIEEQAAQSFLPEELTRQTGPGFLPEQLAQQTGAGFSFKGFAPQPNQGLAPQPAPDPCVAFCHQLQQLVNTLVDQCPRHMLVPDPLAPGRMTDVAITIDRNGLNTLIHCIKTEWKEELLLYLPTRKCPRQAPFSPSLPYLLLGWLSRHSTLFGHLPKKQMAQLLCRQTGCPYKPSTMETYLTKGIDDGLLTNDYPLMRSLKAYLKAHGKEGEMGDE